MNADNYAPGNYQPLYTNLTTCLLHINPLSSSDILPVPIITYSAENYASWWYTFQLPRAVCTHDVLSRLPKLIAQEAKQLTPVRWQKNTRYPLLKQSADFIPTACGDRKDAYENHMDFATMKLLK